MTFVSFLIHLGLRYFQVNTLMLQIQRILVNRTGKMSYECRNNMFLRNTFHLLIRKNYLFDNSVFLEEARGPSRRGNLQQDWNWPIFSQRHCKDHLQWHQAKVFTMFQVEMLTLVPNLSLKSVMSYTTQICQDSVLLAGQRVKRKL